MEDERLSVRKIVIAGVLSASGSGRRAARGG
jgi:hypothetical protein